MFDVHREGRDRADAKQATQRIDPLQLMWGENRREADAFIMTQLTHLESRWMNLFALLVIFAASYFAYHEGYRQVAWACPLAMFTFVVAVEMDYRRRQKSITKLMSRNLHLEDNNY